MELPCGRKTQNISSGSSIGKSRQSVGRKSKISAAAGAIIRVDGREHECRVRAGARTILWRIFWRGSDAIPYRGIAGYRLWNVDGKTRESEPLAATGRVCNTHMTVVVFRAMLVSAKNKRVSVYAVSTGLVFGNHEDPRTHSTTRGMSE